MDLFWRGYAEYTWSTFIKLHGELLCILYIGFGERIIYATISSMVSSINCLWEQLFFILNSYLSKFYRLKCIIVHLQRIPFNWKNPIGYVIAFFIQSGSHYFVLQAVIVNLCYFMGVCEFLMAFTKDMEAELVAINECNKTENCEKEVEKRLGDFIKLHSETKEYINISKW